MYVNVCGVCVQVHLAFFGDGNTIRWNTDGLPAFEEHFAFKYNALALGKRGDTTQNLIWRLRNGELGSSGSGFAPKVAVINVGGNDMTAYLRETVLLGRCGALPFHVHACASSRLAALSEPCVALTLVWFWQGGR